MQKTHEGEGNRKDESLENKPVSALRAVLQTKTLLCLVSKP